MNLARLMLLLLLPAGAWGGDLYHVHRMSEREVVRMYEALLRDACHHADGFWHTSSFEPAAGYWGDGVSDGNEGIRAIGEMVLTCGTLVKYCPELNAIERQDWLGKARAAVRYATATHVTGTHKCSNGKQWGNSWQSAMWAGTLAFGTWLLWDELDPDLKKDVERVVAYEADRFLASPPPTGLWADTKAEENGWDLICIALAENMFPTHAHAAAWHNKTLEYAMNTLSAPQDLEDTRVVDGRAVKDWVKGPNVQPDFTLENHNIFHPSYVACSSYFLTQTAMYYTYAGRTAPQAAAHHLMDTWRMFQTIILPCGEAAYPQSMDWELHGLSFINLYASLATYRQDHLAAHLEQMNLQYQRAWQNMGHGDLTVPGSRLGFTRHAICAEQAAYGYLAHKIFGPAVKEMSSREAASSCLGAREYPYVDFIEHRTLSKFACFSWKNRIMGMVIPIGDGHEGNPEFTVPMVNGLVGSFELQPHGDAGSKVLEHGRKALQSGFETTGTLSLNGGRLRQELKLTSIGEKTVVYQDRVTALSEVTVAYERGVPVGIENDELSGGTRTLCFRDGAASFGWHTRQHLAPVPGSWANVDGRLGVVVAAGSGMCYAPASDYHPHMAVCTDVLYGSFVDKPRRFKSGEQVARRVVVFFTEVTPRKTAALSNACKIEDKADGEVLRFKLPEGGAAEVPLL